MNETGIRSSPSLKLLPPTRTQSPPRRAVAARRRQFVHVHDHDHDHDHDYEAADD